MIKQISLIIFACFTLTQGWEFYAGIRSTPVFRTSSTPIFIPVRVDIDRTLDPPRRVVAALTRAAVHAPLTALYSCEYLKNGKEVTRRGAPPEVCWVFGRKMAWSRVTERNLRRIPGIGTAMAARLIRIRDTEPLTAFSDLRRFSHIGKKPVQTLQKFCYIDR